VKKYLELRRQDPLFVAGAGRSRLRGSVSIAAAEEVPPNGLRVQLPES